MSFEIGEPEEKLKLTATYCIIYCLNQSVPLDGSTWLLTEHERQTLPYMVFGHLSQLSPTAEDSV